MASHVLLAGCKSTQQVLETLVGNMTRGCFSSQLIPKLRELYHRSVSVSYSELMEQVSSHSRQTPQCHGKNKDRLLFTLEASTKSKHYCSIKVSASSTRCNELEVDFGTMHGVVRGTEFLVVHGPTRKHLGKLVAKKVQSKRSFLIYPSDNPEFDIPEDAEARICKWNNKDFILDVFTDAEDLKNAVSTDSIHTGYSLRATDKNSNPHVSVSVNENKKYEFERLPGFFTDTDIEGGKRGTAGDLSIALDAICHFRSHLCYSQSIHTSLSANNPIEMKLKSLKGEPIGENLFDTQYHAVLKADENEEYGLHIRNQSQSDLFVWVFYFDPADFSIQVRLCIVVWYMN